ncbi:NUDIX hydrolase [Brachymonas sp. G34]|nr:NUDIX hydrolase [Brachymonas sp. J145]MEE1653329.1 NUDIX hydrolase [Brachymonas sp. J145]NLX16095.1 NUDIX hydrolase [Ramlibacter sp.]
MMERWTPRVTVAAVLEHEGRFLLVEERQTRGLVLNNAAGHLDRGESLVHACVREVLEETAYDFTPEALVGVYLSRYQGHDPKRGIDRDLTFLRFTFCGQLGQFHSERELDTPIERTLWLTPDEIRASVHRHRSPMVLRSLEDYLSGHRFPLDTIYAHESVTNPACFETR